MLSDIRLSPFPPNKELLTRQAVEECGWVGGERRGGEGGTAKTKTLSIAIPRENVTASGSFFSRDHMRAFPMIPVPTLPHFLQVPNSHLQRGRILLLPHNLTLPTDQLLQMEASQDFPSPEPCGHHNLASSRDPAPGLLCLFPLCRVPLLCPGF